MSSEITEHELGLLTDEEREAVTSNEVTPGDETALRNIAGDDGGDGDDGDDNETIDADGNVVTPAAKLSDPNAPVADDPAKPTATVDVAKPAPAATVVDSTYRASLPEDFDTKVAGLAEAETQAWANFDKGEIDREGLQAELRRVNEERSQLTSLRTKAEISQEMSQQTSQALWQAQIQNHIKAAKSPEMGGIDYQADSAKLNDLDLFVKTLAAIPENADKGGDWYLTEAHKRVLALHGLTAKAPETPKPGANRNKTPLADAPKNLSQVPGGDGPGDMGSEFASLDELDGDDLEAALKKLSPAQRAKYAAGG